MRNATRLALFLGLAFVPAARLLADDSPHPPPSTAPAKAAPGKDWTDHMGDIPFLVGRDVGLKEVEFTGKPIFYFYTATW